MQNLRVQLLLSHLLLVLLMTIVMSGAVVSFFRLGGSIDRILRNNYDSVVTAQNMKEALERQDSAATFFLAGKVAKARQQFEAYEPLFEQAYRAEAHNITEPGEQQLANDIGQRFAVYRLNLRRLLYANPPLPPAQANEYYFRVLEPSFLGLKQRAQDVLELNQTAIQKADLQARREAEQAAWIGIGVTLAASLAATLLALYRIQQAMGPLRLLARRAEEIGAGRLEQRVGLRRSDEIGLLAAAFDEMADKLVAARQALVERLQRAEGMSDAALESLYDPVVVADAAGRVVHLNRAAEGLFGPEERATGRAVGEVVGQRRIAAAVEQAIRREHVSAEEGEQAFMEFPAGKEDTRTYRLRVSPVAPDDRAGQPPLGAVVVLEDVTYLRQLDRLKTEFIGVASHELRTPVTSLLLSTQLLLEGAVGDLTTDQAQIVGAQRQDLERLQGLLRDLLDLTRLEAGATPPRREIVRVREFVEAALAAVQTQAREKGVALNEEMHEEATVRADRAQMTRVLVNLLNNAVRHTPSGGQVTVAVNPSEGASVCLSVRDTGSGIPPAYRDRIFERFVQVPGATRGGAGLGLSISQSIVRAHGGELSVQSEEGKGSVFTLTLPRASTPPLEDAQTVNR